MAARMGGDMRERIVYPDGALVEIECVARSES